MENTSVYHFLFLRFSLGILLALFELIEVGSSGNNGMWCDPHYHSFKRIVHVVFNQKFQLSTLNCYMEGNVSRAYGCVIV